VQQIGFLLQNLLFAQHVSGTNMSIIRSSRVLIAFKHVQDGTGFIPLLVGINKTSSILDMLESFHQTCMTYTSAECTVENS
jgi:hypothetical protein